MHESLMVSLFGPSTTWKSGWLNDSVINAYVVVLEKRADKNGKVVIAANSFFLERTKQGKPWRRRLDISQYKKFVFPCQATQRYHWILGVIDLENCTISQVDPAGGRNPEFFDVVRDFLTKRSELEGRHWTDLAIPHPLQNNDVSCGVYVLKIAECITERKEITFQQNDIDDYRWEIAYRLLNDGNW